MPVSPSPIDVVFLAFDGIQTLDLTGPHDVFAGANAVLDDVAAQRSERHFTRRFTEQVGISPARYVASVRLDAARRALETSTDTVEAIARRCGFGTAETMRRTFARRIAATPDQYRQRFRRPDRPAALERSPT